MRRETTSAYLKAAGIRVRPPGGWGHASKPAIEVTTDFIRGKRDKSALKGPQLSKPAIQVTTDSGRPRGPDSSPNLAALSKPAIEVTTDSGSAGDGSEVPVSPPKARTLSHCEPYRELIEAGLQRGRNAMAIWQDLVTDQGFAHSYQSVKRFVNKLQPRVVKEARAVIITEPGEEAQVDYGTGPMVLDRQTGKYRRTRLFVMTLGYSRKSVRLLTFRSSARLWAELHETAFRRLGGSVRVVVLEYVPRNIFRIMFPPTICSREIKSARKNGAKT